MQHDGTTASEARLKRLREVPGPGAGGGDATASTLPATLAFLRRSLHPDQVIETHAAYVLLAGHRAYKLKKPVNLGCFDHRRLPAREAACREELRLNRELAGRAVYLGLMPITATGGGTLQMGGAGRLVDWLVVMRRLPAQRMLDVVLQSGARPSVEEIAVLAERLARFYRRPGAAPQAAAPYLAHLRGESAANRNLLHQHRQHLPGITLDRLLIAGADLIEAAAPAIAARASAGLIVEGHGDLRPEHVCLTHPPVIFDRVEFSPALRHIDVGDEVNTLALECRMLGAPEVGRALTDHMAVEGFPPPPAALLRCYTVFRCLTRARLCLGHLAEEPPRSPEKWPPRARAYLAEAARALDEALPD